MSERCQVIHNELVIWYLYGRSLISGLPNVRPEDDALAASIMARRATISTRKITQHAYRTRP